MTALFRGCNEFLGHIDRGIEGEALFAEEHAKAEGETLLAGEAGNFECLLEDGVVAGGVLIKAAEAPDEVEGEVALAEDEKIVTREDKGYEGIVFVIRGALFAEFIHGGVGRALDAIGQSFCERGAGADGVEVGAVESELLKTQPGEQAAKPVNVGFDNGDVLVSVRDNKVFHFIRNIKAATVAALVHGFD